MPEAQRIRVTNSNLGVTISFAAKSDAFETPWTNQFYNQSAVIDLANFPISEGLFFTPDVNVVAYTGKAPPSPPPITFKMNGQTANYSVQGSAIWDWSVRYDSLDPPSGRPSVPGVFPADVPLNLLPYRKWFQDIKDPSQD
jgi:hypothetical protein